MEVGKDVFSSVVKILLFIILRYNSYSGMTGFNCGLKLHN